MTKVKCLDMVEKNTICQMYSEGQKIKDIAKWMDTSSRTVGRVLTERGMVLPKKVYEKEVEDLIRVAREFKLTAAHIRKMMSKHENIALSTVSN